MNLAEIAEQARADADFANGATHTVPRLGELAKDYRLLFTGRSGSFVAWSLAAIAADAILVWTLSWALNTMPDYGGGSLSFLLMLGVGFLLLWGPLAAFCLMAPVLARLVAPVIIGSLELLRGLLYCLQAVTGAFLVERLTRFFFYPKDDH